MKYFKKLFLSCTLAAFASFSAGRVMAAFDDDHIVVMISLDGLAGFYLDDPKAEMPNILALARDGARASSMLSVSPTVTWPNHVTLVTGVTPARHGVVGNNYYDRQKGESVTLIRDPVFDQDQIVKVPTLYDLAKANGLRTAGIHWPATRNAKALDWTVPAMRSMEQLRQFSTPSLLKECEENGIPLSDTKSSREPGELSDELYQKVFNFVLKKHRPQFALLHLGNVDHTEHSHGPRSAAAYAAIKAVDAQVGEVWKELQTDFPGKATLFIVSDHGFSTIDRTISPNVVLRQAGLSNSKKKQAQAVAQGGSAMIYILDEVHRAVIAEKITGAFGKLKGIRKIVGPDQLQDYGMANPKDDPHAPDIFILGDQGTVFGDTSDGNIPFSEKPERKGSHGQDPSLPDLHAAFVAWGAGIKPGVKIGEIKNLDVAPTIAKILQVILPSPEGKTLTDILTP